MIMICLNVMIMKCWQDWSREEPEHHDGPVTTAGSDHSAAVVSLVSDLGQCQESREHNYHEPVHLS